MWGEEGGWAHTWTSRSWIISFISGFGFCPLSQIMVWWGADADFGRRDELQKKGNVLAISRWLVPWWSLGILFVYLFFLKVLLLIVFFLRTGLFPSSLGISIVFIEDLLNAQDCVKCLWVLFPWFMMSDYNPLGWGNSSEGTHLCLTDEATEVQRSEDNCPGNSE